MEEITSVSHPYARDERQIDRDQWIFQGIAMTGWRLGYVAAPKVHDETDGQGSSVLYHGGADD